MSSPNVIDATAVSKNEYNFRSAVSSYMYCLYELFNAFNIKDEYNRVLSDLQKAAPNNVTLTGISPYTTGPSAAFTVDPVDQKVTYKALPGATTNTLPVYPQTVPYRGNNQIHASKLKWLKQVVMEETCWRTLSDIANSANPAAYRPDTLKDARIIYDWYRRCCYFKEYAHYCASQSGITAFKYPIPSIYEYLTIKLGTYDPLPATARFRTPDQLTNYLKREGVVIKAYKENADLFVDPLVSTQIENFQSTKDHPLTHINNSVLHQFLNSGDEDRINENVGGQSQYVKKYADSLNPVQTTSVLEGQRDENGNAGPYPFVSTDTPFRRLDSPTTVEDDEEEETTTFRSSESNIPPPSLPPSRTLLKDAVSSAGYVQRAHYDSTKDKTVHRGQQRNVNSVAQALRLIQTTTEEMGIKDWFKNTCGSICHNTE